MNVGYSVSKLKAMIESNNSGGKAYLLDRNIENKIEKLADTTNLCKYASMVVFQDKIHVLGGDGYATRHETWDGEKWTLLPQTPMYIQNSCVVVFKDCIHVFGSGSSAYLKNHYKYDGTTWTKLADLSFSCTGGGICCDENYIYIINSSGYFYKYDAETDTTTELAQLTSNTGTGCTLLYDNGTIKYFYKVAIHQYIESSNKWGVFSPTGLSNSDKVAVCIYNDKIYGIPSWSSTSVGVGIYEYNKATYTWTKVISFDTGFNLAYPQMVVYKGFMHFIRGNNLKEFYKYKFGSVVTGYVDKDTYVYIPTGKKVIYGDVETVEGGYIAKSNTEIVIGE